MVSAGFESFPSSRTYRAFPAEWRREAVVKRQATTLLVVIVAHQSGQFYLRIQRRLCMGWVKLRLIDTG